jgi:hypothetical protein
MPYRFQFLERVAFTLVVMFALGCTTLIAYERNPEMFQLSVQYGKDALRWTSEYSMACSSPAADACARMTLE